MTAAEILKIVYDSTSKLLKVGLQAGSNLIGKVSIDQTTDGTTNKVQARNTTHDNLQCNANLQVGDSDVSTTNQLPVKSNQSQVSATITRPDNATPYSIGDVVGQDPAANLSFANVCTANGAGFIIMGVNLIINTNSVPAGMTTFKLHLYNAAPTAAITDNLAYNLASGDRAKYLGYITLATPVDLGDTLFSQNDNINFKSKLAAGATTIYGVLQTNTAFTPTNNCVKSIELKVVEV